MEQTICDLSALRAKKAFLCDMDGVIYHGNELIPHVDRFVRWLEREGKDYLFLTNGSGKSPRELSEKLARMGLSVSEEHFYTSALATASFLAGQCPGGTAYVTDLGMTGPDNGILGTDTERVLRKMRQHLPSQFIVADGKIRADAVLFELDGTKVTKISRLKF